MAGDWMKVELELPDKPEVHYIAGVLNLDPDAVVGKLLRVWGWFDKHTENGNAVGVTFTLLDRITNVTGFAEAMAVSGWLEQDGHVLIIPNFDRHNGKSAKKRALTAKRVNQHKLKTNAEGNAPSVNNALPREEKRREENKDICASDDALTLDELFEKFYLAYPKKRSRGQAEKAFKKINPNEQLVDQMVSMIERAKTSEDWKKEKGKFIPYPATWLNAKGWKDEIEMPKKKEVVL